MTHKYFSLLMCPLAQMVPYHRSTSSPAYRGALEGIKNTFSAPVMTYVSYMSAHHQFV